MLPPFDSFEHFIQSRFSSPDRPQFSVADISQGFFRIENRNFRVENVYIDDIFLRPITPVFEPVADTLSRSFIRRPRLSRKRSRSVFERN